MCILIRSENKYFLFFFLTKYFFGILYFKIIFQKLLGNEHFIGIKNILNKKSLTLICINIEIIILWYIHLEENFFSI